MIGGTPADAVQARRRAEGRLSDGASRTAGCPSDAQLIATSDFPMSSATRGGGERACCADDRPTAGSSAGRGRTWQAFGGSTRRARCSAWRVRTIFSVSGLRRPCRMASWAWPPLTTIRQPAAWKMAARPNQEIRPRGDDTQTRVETGHQPGRVCAPEQPSPIAARLKGAAKPVWSGLSPTQRCGRGRKRLLLALARASRSYFPGRGRSSTTRALTDLWTWTSVANARLDRPGAATPRRGGSSGRHLRPDRRHHADLFCARDHPRVGTEGHVIYNAQDPGGAPGLTRIAVEAPLGIRTPRTSPGGDARARAG